MARKVSPEDLKREAFRAFMERMETNPNRLARDGKFSVSAIYNFLNGDTNSLSSTILQKIAKTTQQTVDSILTGTVSRAFIPVLYIVGAGGVLFPMDETFVERPPGVSTDDLVAARIDEGGLHPLPSGWTVFYTAAANDPETLIGKLAVVRWSGGGERPVIRTIRRGSKPGAFTLHALDGKLTEDVTILAAHAVVAIADAKPVTK
jgi:hypothetical protein